MARLSQLHGMISEEADPYPDVVGVLGQLSDTKGRLSELEQQFRGATDRLCNDLALRVRQGQPLLEVSLNKHGCTVRYHSKSLRFMPDVQNHLWLVDGSDQAIVRRFSKMYGDKLHMSEASNTGLSAAIAEFFKSLYRSL